MALGVGIALEKAGVKNATQIAAFTWIGAMFLGAGLGGYFAGEKGDELAANKKAGGVSGALPTPATP